MQECTFTAEGFAHLAESCRESLRELHLSYAVVVGGGSIAESVAKLNKIERLTLNRCRGIGMDVVHVVSKFSITEMDMNRQSKGIDGAELLKVLETEFKSLRKLDLHHWKGHREERAAFRKKRPEVKKGKIRG